MNEKKLNNAPKKGNSRGIEMNKTGLRFFQMFGVGFAVTLVAGCSSLNIGKNDYSCPGMPDGVQCMAARDVYASTNNGEVPRPSKQEDSKTETATENGKGKESSSIPEKRDVVVDNFVAPRLPDRPIPVRTPAQVMRIWVAPWEDTNGDLIVPGYVYTEIEPRKWVFGEGVGYSDPVLKPLQTVNQDISVKPK